MKHFTRFLVVSILASLLATPALGKDVCVDAGSGEIIFKKVKSLKKPGRAVALHGLYLLSSVVPVTGTAVVLADGSVNFGVLVHTTPPLGAYSFTASLEGDASFAATGNFEATDGSILAPMTWTPIDCKTLLLP